MPGTASSSTPPTYLRLELSLGKPAGGGSLDLAGGTLRGLLGKALVDAFCPFGEPRCDPRSKPSRQGRSGPPPPPTDLCRLAAACPYGVLYAASLTRRPPYALFVSAPEGKTEPSLEITLYGPAWRYYPWIVAVLHGALDGERPVTAVHRLRPDRSRGRLSTGHLPELPADLEPDILAPAPEPFVAPKPVAVELLSPTKLLAQGKPIPRAEPVPFEILIKSTLDRFAGLYGAGASEILTKSVRATIEAEAARVPLVSDETTWREASHPSRRSRHRLALDGRVGRLVYGEQASWFFHILRAAEILHLGKNPTFGSGRLQVDLVEE